MLDQALAGLGTGTTSGVVYENGVGKWTRCEVLGRGAHGVVYRGVAEGKQKSIAVKQIQTNGMGRSQLQAESGAYSWDPFDPLVFRDGVYLYRQPPSGQSRFHQVTQLRTDGVYHRESTGTEPEILKAAVNEIEMLPRLRHPNVVRFLGIEEVDDRLNIFLEYLDKGSVRDRLEREGRMSEAETAGITKKFLAGLAYLHSQGITHRDIKGANVLLSRGGAVKLADFGTSKLVNQESVMSGLKGTPHWMAPEVIRDQQQGHEGWIRADVWSVGCMVIEMLTGKRPWPDVPNAVAVMFKIARGMTPPIDREISPEASSFIRACCCPEPSRRQTVEQLVKHPFLVRPRCHGVNAAHPADPTGSLLDDLVQDFHHVVNAACPRGSRRERRCGSPCVQCWASNVSPPCGRHSQRQVSFLELGYSSSNNTFNASRDSTINDQVFVERELLSSAGWEGSAAERPPCRSRETTTSTQRRRPKNLQPPGRSAAVVAAAAGTALGTVTTGGPEASPTRKTGTATGPPSNEKQQQIHHHHPQQQQRLKWNTSARRVLWTSIQPDSYDGNADAWSPPPVFPQDSLPPTRSPQHWRSTDQAPKSDASLPVNREEASPSYVSLSGHDWVNENARAGIVETVGGDVSDKTSLLESRMAILQRLVASEIRKEQQQQQQNKILLQKRIASMCRLLSCRGEAAAAAAGLTRNPSYVWCEIDSSNNRRSAGEEIQLKQKLRQRLRLPSFAPTLPKLLAVNRARPDHCDGHGRGGESSPPIPTSPVSTKRASGLAGQRPFGLHGGMESDTRHQTVSHGSDIILTPVDSGDASFVVRHNTSYTRSPCAVRVATRECLEESERLHVGLNQTKGPIAAEYMKIERQRGLVGLAPRGCIASNNINMGHYMPASSKPRRGKSDPTPQAIMRTRSAGAIASAVKLPPLDHDADVMRTGERATCAVGPGADCFGGILTGTRLITSAPTVVDSSPLSSVAKGRADAAVRFNGVPRLSSGPGRHYSPMDLFAKHLISPACYAQRPAECYGDSSGGRTAVTAPGGDGDSSDSRSARVGNGTCQNARTLRCRASLSLVRANVVSPMKTASMLSPKSAKGGTHITQMDEITESKGSGPLASIPSLPSPRVNSRGATRSVLTTSCKSNSVRLHRREFPGAENAAGNACMFSDMPVQAVRAAATAVLAAPQESTVDSGSSLAFDEAPYIRLDH